MQFLHGFPRFGTDFVLDGNCAEHAPVCDDEEHRFALAAPGRIRFSHLWGRRHVACGQKTRSADRDRLAIDEGLCTATRQRFEPTSCERHNAASFRFGNNDFGKWVFGIHFDGGSTREQVLLADTWRNHYARKRRGAARERSSLVENAHIQIARPFESEPVSDQEAVLRAKRGRDSNYEWNGQA